MVRLMYVMPLIFPGSFLISTGLKSIWSCGAYHLRPCGSDHFGEPINRNDG